MLRRHEHPVDASLGDSTRRSSTRWWSATATATPPLGLHHLPDVCPTDLARITAALQSPGPDADQVVPVFVTVDPARRARRTLARLDSASELMQTDAIDRINLRQAHVRTTVTIEDELVEQALALADPAMPRSALFREALQAFVRQQAARRLAALGGTAPRMADIPRRRDTRVKAG